MEVCVWKLIWLCTSLSIAFAVERSIWKPTCSTSLDNTLIPHPSDCRKFFVCIQETAYPVTCPYGLSWNPRLKKCSTLSNCKNEQHKKVPKYNPLCPLDENPANPTHLPDQNDCRKFYECEGGFAFHMECPEGLHWSVEHDNCEHASVANCKYSQKLIGNGQLNAACPLNEDPSKPTHLPHPTDCTKFYKCAFGRSYIVSCPFGLHWNVEDSRCDSPFNAQCDNNKTKLTSLPTMPSLAPAIETPPAQAISSPNLSPNIPICSDDDVKNYGIPGQCDKYFSCSRGKLYLVNCREGREWSELVKGCVQSSVARCTGLISGFNVATSVKKPLSKPILSSNIERPLVTTNPISCSPDVKYLSHSTDCHKFIVCDNGRPVEMLCPDGLFFNRNTNICQWTDTDC